MAGGSEGIPTFGGWVKQRRMTLDLTQSALAKSVGCAVATIQKIEQGARTPSTQVAELLAKALNTPADDFALVVAAARSGVAPVLRAAAPHMTRVDDLIGRDAQLSALATILLNGGHRLVTLVGPGGVGKTALAQALAHALAPRFEDGARVVSLAEARTPALVPDIAARALCPGARIGDVSALLKALRLRKQLIVFDNFEHVLPAAGMLARIADAAPGVTLLATSREALGLRGEHVTPVRPLASADARALFVRHARLADPRWHPVPGDEAAIDALCRAFDGLPLAIQLCAAHVALLPPAVLLRRMLSEQGMPRIELVADTLADLPLRHQSLDDTIRWSYERLTPSERDAFQHMAVFAGGADTRAAEALLGGPVAAWPLLIALLRKSLLARTLGADEASARFTLLETLRAFAVRQATRDGAWPAIRDQHAAHFLMLAEANERLRPFNARIDAQEREAQNFYAAMSHTWQTDPAAALRLFRALLKFWRTRFRFSDQLLMAEEGLGALPHSAHAARGELHMQAGSACIALERIDEAAAHLSEADALLQGDRDAAAALLWRVRDLQGLLAERRHDLDESLARHRDAAALAPNATDAARAKLHMGRAAAMAGQFEEAERTLDDVVATIDPDDENLVLALLLLAHARTMLNRLDDAEQMLARCASLVERYRMVDWRGGIYQAQGALAYLRGDTQAALRAADRSRGEFAAISDPTPALANCDRVRALLLIEIGDVATGAAVLSEAVAGLRFADDSVAGVAVLAGLAAVLLHNNQTVAASAAAERVAHAFASVDLTRRVFADATAIELAFARRLARQPVQMQHAEPLNDAISRALARHLRTIADQPDADDAQRDAEQVDRA